MTRISRRVMLALFGSFALTAAACVSTTPTTSPSPRPDTIASTAEPSKATSASPAPADSRSATASASELACTLSPQSGLLPSDRLVDLAISSTPTDDLLTFVFEHPTSPTPAGPPRGSLESARPPFSFAGSGQQIVLLGAHFVQVRFSGMTIASESGEATYNGASDVKPDLSALREAILYDASEGSIGWYVGYDGPGCVTLSRNGNDVTVVFAHSEAPAG